MRPLTLKVSVIGDTQQEQLLNSASEWKFPEVSAADARFCGGYGDHCDIRLPKLQGIVSQLHFLLRKSADRYEIKLVCDRHTTLGGRPLIKDYWTKLTLDEEIVIGKPGKGSQVRLVPAQENSATLTNGNPAPPAAADILVELKSLNSKVGSFKFRDFVECSIGSSVSSNDIHVRHSDIKKVHCTLQPVHGADGIGLMITVVDPEAKVYVGEKLADQICELSHGDVISLGMDVVGSGVGVAAFQVRVPEMPRPEKPGWLSDVIWDRESAKVKAKKSGKSKLGLSAVSGLTKSKSSSSRNDKNDRASKRNRPIVVGAPSASGPTDDPSITEAERSMKQLSEEEAEWNAEHGKRVRILMAREAQLSADLHALKHEVDVELESQLASLKAQQVALEVNGCKP